MDNLTDLSHAGFVHVDTLEPREIAKASYEVSESKGRVWTRQLVPSMEVPPPSPSKTSNRIRSSIEECFKEFRARFRCARQRNNLAVFDIPTIVLLIANIEPQILILEYLDQALMAVNSKTQSMRGR